LLKSWTTSSYWREFFIEANCHIAIQKSGSFPIDQSDSSILPLNYKTIFIVDKGNELSYVGLLLSLLVRSPERYLHNPLSLLLFLAGSFGRFFPRQGRNFISRAYVYRSSWTSCLTGCLSSFLSVLAKSMNTQVTQIHSTIVKLRRAIGTNPEAELAGHVGLRTDHIWRPGGQPIGTPRQTIFGAPGATYRHPGQGILAPPGARNYGVGERWKVRMQN
jgi:hypothetical protein